MQTVTAVANTQAYFPLTRQLFGFARHYTLNFLETLGLAIQHTVWLLWWSMFEFPRNPRLWPKQLAHTLRQAAFVGVDTLGICLVLTTVAAMVIALQLASELAKQGAENFVGSLVSMAMIRELGPIMTAVGVISMAGSAFTAELMTMQISKQVDALRMMHIEPVRYLMGPRVLAAIGILPIITLLTTVSSLYAAMLISQWLGNVPPSIFWDAVWSQTQLKDLWTMLFKASVFGYIIAILSTTIGLHPALAMGGAKAVGEATTRSVVWSFLTVAVVDYLITYMVYGSR